jgi:signal transduction histidine kinase
VGALAAGVAHDFNNIVAGIRGVAESLAHRLRSEEPQRLLTEQILQACKRAGRVADRLLGADGRGLHHPRLADLSEVVLALAGELDAKGGRDITIRRELVGGLPRVNLDPDRIAVLLHALVANSVEAMPSGGELVIRTGLAKGDPCAAEGERPDRRYLSLEVSDTGQGMDEQTRERAFEPYFTTKEFGRSAGLGLSQCYGITREHGGCIRLASRPGEGTTVSVYLPVP